MSRFIRFASLALIISAFPYSAHGQQQSSQVDQLYDEVKRLHKLKQFGKSISLLKQILAISKKKTGPYSPDVLYALRMQALAYEGLGRIDEAERSYKSALAIIKRAWRPSAPIADNIVEYLASLYFEQGRAEEAVTLYEDLLDQREKEPEANSQSIAATLEALGRLYSILGRYVEAEAAYRRLVHLRLGAQVPSNDLVGVALQHLGGLWWSQGRVEEAEALYLRALSIHKKQPNTDPARVAAVLDSLGKLYTDQDRFEQAEPFFKHAIDLVEQSRPVNRRNLATALSNLGLFYVKAKRLKKVEPLYQRALEIYQSLVPNNPTYVAHMLTNLAELYHHQERYTESEAFFMQAVKLSDKHASADDPNVGTLFFDFANLYQTIGRYEEAEKLYLRSLAIFEKAKGADHHKVSAIFEELVKIYARLNRKKEEEKTLSRLAQFPPKGTRHVPLFFVTNRSFSSAANFGDKVSATNRFGRATVTVPRSEIRNRAQRIADSLGRLEVAKTGKLTSASVLELAVVKQFRSAADFSAAIGSSQKRSVLFKNEALVFVHGYNNDFEGMLRRATQLSFDLSFDGTLIPFSWPSEGHVASYLGDQNRALASVDSLVALLDTIAETLPGLKVNLLAHSMGNQIMLRALCKIAKRRNRTSHNFGQIIAAHADIRPEDFDKLTKCFVPIVAGTTLYANEKDAALSAGCMIFRFGFRCRAGNFIRGYEAADLIDTTQMAQGRFRALSEGFDHDVFIRNPILFSDITRLILNGRRPVELRSHEFQSMTDIKGRAYWKYIQKRDTTAFPTSVSPR